MTGPLFPGDRPLTDAEVGRLGWEPTRRGWAPVSGKPTPPASPEVALARAVAVLWAAFGRDLIEEPAVGAGEREGVTGGSER